MLFIISDMIFNVIDYGFTYLHSLITFIVVGVLFGSKMVYSSSLSGS